MYKQKSVSTNMNNIHLVHYHLWQALGRADNEKCLASENNPPKSCYSVLLQYQFTFFEHLFTFVITGFFTVIISTCAVWGH